MSYHETFLTRFVGNKVNRELQRLETEEQRVKEKLELSKKLSGGKRGREELDEEEDEVKETEEKQESSSHKRHKVSETEEKQPKGGF